MGKQAIEPVPLDTKQKAALRRLERVTGRVSQTNESNHRIFIVFTEQFQTESDSVARNLWVRRDCAEDSICSKLRFHEISRYEI